MGEGCYHICYNSTHYYSPEQEREDALWSESMPYVPDYERDIDPDYELDAADYFAANESKYDQPGYVNGPPLADDDIPF